MAELPPCRRTTWADVDRWADALAEKVRRAGPTPEVIVGLTRGGWVASRLLADRLAVRRMSAIRAQHWGVTATPDGKAELTEGLTTDLTGQRALVVDDITDTGESLALATEHVREVGHPAHLDSATFLHIGHSKFVPTFFAEEIPRDRWVWVVFPWNYWEDLRTLVERAKAVRADADGVRTLLKERCGLDISLEDVTRVLREDA